MKVIKPASILSAVVSTTAVDTDAEWSSATSYTANQRVTLEATRRIYVCLQPSLNERPDVSPLAWVDYKPMNKWAMFDSQVSTVTSVAGSLTVVLSPGKVNSLAMFAISGTSVSITVQDGPLDMSPTVRMAELNNAVISDWYEYFFSDNSVLDQYVVTDLPPYVNAILTVTLNGTSTRCGHLMLGSVYDLGGTEFGATTGITDYSRKDTDEFGITTFTQRAYSKRMNLRLMLGNGRVDYVQRLLASLRATPCAWIGTQVDNYEVLTVFGFYKDFSIEVAYAATAYCSIEIEGLT
ncbi:MAG: hypothetical protein NTZ64_18090 [Polaromonas sp.]|nr:hypothetical protein [Polaromonas sp.]